MTISFWAVSFQGCTWWTQTLLRLVNLQNKIKSYQVHHDHSNILNDHQALCIFIIFIFQSKPRPDTPITPHAVSGTWQSALLALSGRNCWVTWCTAIHLRVRFPGPTAVANAAAHWAFWPVLLWNNTPRITTVLRRFSECKRLEIPEAWMEV